MGTKTYAEKQAKKLLKKRDNNWSLKVKTIQPTCIICGTTSNLNAHHIIPREIAETRHIILNGVTLCAKHHKLNIFSAHRSSVWFLLHLKQKQPESYNLVFNAIPMLPLKKYKKHYVATIN